MYPVANRLDYCRHCVTAQAVILSHSSSKPKRYHRDICATDFIADAIWNSVPSTDHSHSNMAIIKTKVITKVPVQLYAASREYKEPGIFKL